MSARSQNLLRGRPRSRNGHKQVEKLPTSPSLFGSYWLNSPNNGDTHLHQLFRFPARFHPPVVRWALGKYGRQGSSILDPFTGSGTVQMEAMRRGISSVGIDVDPLACLVADVKTHPISPGRLEWAYSRIKTLLSRYEKAHKDREVRPGSDISPERFSRETSRLTIPPIPDITHWFRRYVTVDLARIFRAIENADLNEPETRFFQLCAVAIVRRVSNADPAPVSGLEVTTIQSERNETRKIQVFDVFHSKVAQASKGMEQLWKESRGWPVKPTAKVIEGDSLNVMDSLWGLGERFPLVVTSPPYCRAVDYARRHRLEMYWLNLISNQDEHIQLAHTYIGRGHVRERDWDLPEEFGIPRLDRTIKKITKVDKHRGRGVAHYFDSMSHVLESLSSIVKSRGTAVLVIGDSVCCDVPISTTEFVSDLAAEFFTLENRFSYVLRNNYMQYGLWNGEGIKKEHVLVFKK